MIIEPEDWYSADFSGSVFISNDRSLHIFNRSLHWGLKGRKMSDTLKKEKLNNQYDFLMGTQPEAIILTINPFDEFDYIKRTIMFLEAAADSKVIAIVIYPVSITDDWTGFYGKKYIKL